MGGIIDGVCANQLNGGSIKLECANNKFSTYLGRDCAGALDGNVTILNECLATQKFTCEDTPYAQATLYPAADTTCVGNVTATLYFAFDTCSMESSTSSRKFAKAATGGGYDDNSYTSPNCTGTATKSSYKGDCTPLTVLPAYRLKASGAGMSIAVNMVLAGAMAIAAFTQF
jgi:hypothetical protein